MRPAASAYSATSAFSVLTAADECPDGLALIFNGQPFTYREIAEKTAVAMAWLQLQLRPGDSLPANVALVTEHRVETFVLLYALVELGIPAILVSARLTPCERQQVIDDSRVQRVLDEQWTLPTGGYGEGQAGSLSTWGDPERPLALINTSGVTGCPKAAILSRRAFLASAAASARNIPLGSLDRWLLMMPLAHVGGVSIVTRCLAARACVVTGYAIGRFDPRPIAVAIEEHSVSLMSAVPTMLKRFLDELPTWRPPASLRAILVGGAPMSSDLLELARDRGYPILTTYGLTEACSQVSAQRFGSRPCPSIGAGEPLEGVEVRLVEGEIQMRGPTLLSGYWSHGRVLNPFSPDGWFATGDLGFFDEGGRLHLKGRRDDLIITGGENVHPAEVELIIERYSGVKAACVFGVQDACWGEMVAAAIVPYGAARPLNLAELEQFCRRHLAPHRRPRRVAFLLELPLIPSGKINRAAIHRQVEGKLRPFLTR
ncbi:MAG: class I adenylate-forming enzyme family protein [Gammaproteobacteria bacterium]